MSQESCSALFAVLAKHYTRAGVTVVDNLSDLELLVARKPDLVFLSVEFILMDSAAGLADPAKIWVAKYLEENGVAYTGSPQMAHELGRDKSLAKQRVLDAGLRTPPFVVIKQHQALPCDALPLTFPVFIKPTNRGGGCGIDSKSVAYTSEQLHAKAGSIAADLHADALVEEYLPGREFSVAVLKDEHSVRFSVMPLELIAPPDEQGVRMLSRKVKLLDIEQAIAVTDTAVKSEVAELAINVFHALGARDYGRIDIRLDKYGTPQFIEANLIPSLISGYGSFPRACVLNMHLGYEAMVLRIVRLGLARSADGMEDKLELNMIDVAPRPLESAFEPV